MVTRKDMVLAVDRLPSTTDQSCQSERVRLDDRNEWNKGYQNSAAAKANTGHRLEQKNELRYTD